MPLTILCIATYRKGDEFLRECARQGCRVLLLTDEKLRDADWPREAVHEFFYITREMPLDDIRKGLAHTARTERLDRIVALDDFDVELAAALREYLRLPGLDETTARAFRDKLAMRTRARAAGIPCPDFVHVLNYAAIAEWTAQVPPPWVMKPRSQAAAIGIKKIASTDELWKAIEDLGDAQADYLLERFVPGDVYHVDAIYFDRALQFAAVSRYGSPPMTVAHEGGIFVTRTLGPEDEAVAPLRELTARVLGTFGMRRGVSHTEFIRSADGGWQFLETSARVGGAYIVDVVEAASGVNLWREWAKLEMTPESGSYQPPPTAANHAAIVLSLARQEHPDTSSYTAPEIVQRIRKRHHVGLIVASPDARRVSALVEEHVTRFYTDFHASAPAPDRPAD